MSAVCFVVGKGGVGKTTIAASYAAWRTATQRRPVLLLSTDPAHSLADIFEVRLGAAVRNIPIASGRPLAVWQMDAAQQFRKFMARHRAAILSVVESGTLFTREEIEPLLDETIPGMAEVAALLTVAELLQKPRYAEIVVDTAPIGHTLRLLQLPEHFLRFLKFLEIASSRDRILAQRFGGNAPPPQPFLAQWREAVEAVHRALTHSESRLLLVTSAEDFALQESLRAAEALRESTPPLQIGEIVLNRVVRKPGRCPHCSARAAAARQGAAFLKKHFRGVPVRVADDSGAPIMGARALRAYGAHVFAGRPAPRALPPPPAHVPVISASTWPTLTTPLTLSIGKGGVGKTTLSAALAFHTRQRERQVAVSICSVDPAPSLDDVFRQPVGDTLQPVLGDPKLRAMEVDAPARFRAFADKLKSNLATSFSADTDGIHVELSFERQVITALLDMTPPGLDELAATLSILDLLEPGSTRVMIDMAPTGHALELLRMPQRILHWARLLLKTLAPHRTLALVRDAAVEIARLQQRVRGLAQALQDPAAAQVVPVMLAEPLPDRETARLLALLRGLRLPQAALLVNRVRLEDPGSCARCRAARQWQAASLAALRKKYRGTIYLAPEQRGGVAGAAPLQSFTSTLWQIGSQPRTRRG